MSSAVENYFDKKYRLFERSKIKIKKKTLNKLDVKITLLNSKE